jgi:hypothetical protein
VEVIAKLQVNPFDYFVEEYAENFLLHMTNASQELTAYLNLSEESYFPKIYGGLKLNKSIPLMIFLSINPFTKNLVTIYEWK